MTDAASATGLTDVWNVVLAVANRQPIQVRVLLVLGALVALILIIDGIRANVRRTKPQTLHIIREPFASARSFQAMISEEAKTRPLKPFRVKQPVVKRKNHKPPRPAINRNTLGDPWPPVRYQPTEWEPSRETPQDPL